MCLTDNLKTMSANQTRAFWLLYPIDNFVITLIKTGAFTDSRRH